VAQLRRLQQDGRYGPEIARRQRLESYLDSIVQSSSRRHKQVARNAEAEALLSTRLTSLPCVVDLSPHELRIAFHGAEDLLPKVGAVVYALQNDFEKIQEFIENSFNQ
jgi:hypothetical protein